MLLKHIYILNIEKENDVVNSRIAFFFRLTAIHRLVAEGPTSILAGNSEPFVGLTHI